jgi:hypothetical protein
MEAQAQDLDNLGAQYFAAYLEVAADSHVTVYLHNMACHMGDLVRQWGGLMKWCSQGAEAMHHMTKFFAPKRSPRMRECVEGDAHPIAHDDDGSNHHAGNSFGILECMSHLTRLALHDHHGAQ